MARNWSELDHSRDDWCRNCCQKIYGLEGRYCGDCLPIIQERNRIDREIDRLKTERSKVQRRIAYRRRKWQELNMARL